MWNKVLTFYNIYDNVDNLGIDYPVQWLKKTLFSSTSINAELITLCYSKQHILDAVNNQLFYVYVEMWGR